jgi:A/G-specific adenine glycosylase
VGAYVSAAVRVFAFNERLTVLDSNVLRILGRYFGVHFPDHARRSARVQAWAKSLAPAAGEPCKRFNWALIDLGASVCLPQSPKCAVCPLNRYCREARRPAP